MIHCNAARATPRRHADAPLSAYYMELVTLVAAVCGETGRKSLLKGDGKKLER